MGWSPKSAAPPSSHAPRGGPTLEEALGRLAGGLLPSSPALRCGVGSRAGEERRGGAARGAPLGHWHRGQRSAVTRQAHARLLEAGGSGAGAPRVRRPLRMRAAARPPLRETSPPPQDGPGPRQVHVPAGGEERWATTAL